MIGDIFSRKQAGEDSGHRDSLKDREVAQTGEAIASNGGSAFANLTNKTVEPIVASVHEMIERLKENTETLEAVMDKDLKKNFDELFKLLRQSVKSGDEGIKNTDAVMARIATVIVKLEQKKEEEPERAEEFDKAIDAIRSMEPKKAGTPIKDAVKQGLFGQNIQERIDELGPDATKAQKFGAHAKGFAMQSLRSAFRINEFVPKKKPLTLQEAIRREKDAEKVDALQSSIAGMEERAGISMENKSTTATVAVDSTKKKPKKENRAKAEKKDLNIENLNVQNATVQKFVVASAPEDENEKSMSDSDTDATTLEEQSLAAKDDEFKTKMIEAMEKAGGGGQLAMLVSSMSKMLPALLLLGKAAAVGLALAAGLKIGDSINKMFGWKTMGEAAEEREFYKDEQKRLDSRDAGIAEKDDADAKSRGYRDRAHLKETGDLVRKYQAEGIPEREARARARQETGATAEITAPTPSTIESAPQETAAAVSMATEDLADATTTQKAAQNVVTNVTNNNISSGGSVGSQPAAGDPRTSDNSFRRWQDKRQVRN